MFLVSTAAWLAFLHALAPDHWMPFVALARASNWSRLKLTWVSFLAALGHVGSSIAIGLAGVFLGGKLAQIQGIEDKRGSVATLLLIGFGLAYMAWGIKHARHSEHHEHVSIDNIGQAVKATFLRRFWILFAVIVFGPCEPIIPLIFLSWAHGAQILALVVTVFSLVTIAMVVLQSLLAYQGFGFIFSKHEKVLARHAHTLAGASILAVGLIVILFGI